MYYLRLYARYTKKTSAKGHYIPRIKGMNHMKKTSTLIIVLFLIVSLPIRPAYAETYEDWKGLSITHSFEKESEGENSKIS